MKRVRTLFSHVCPISSCFASGNPLKVFRSSLSGLSTNSSGFANSFELRSHELDRSTPPLAPLNFLFGNSLNRVIKNCPKRLALYNKIKPKLFDVSLRDGIQNASPIIYTTEYKKQILNDIIERENPNNIEIGSIVSPKILPILADSLEMYKYAKKEITKKENSNTERISGCEAVGNRTNVGERSSNMFYKGIYVLIPSHKKLEEALTHNITHFSFITSVSEKFQMKNTNKSLNDTKNELLKMRQTLNAQSFGEFKTKLYISCINHCPIEGKISNVTIIRELLYYYYTYRFDELCLSDTCGTLSFNDFEYLVDELHHFGIPVSVISLHLHTKDRENVKKILRYSFDNNINKFDVSFLETGGCSVTMDPTKLLPNLSYDLFYEALDEYITSRV